MPTYEYQCERCGCSFEWFQSMKDDPLETCPKDRCEQKRWGKGKVRRQIGTGAGLIFKGSGFYITDYRSEGYKEAAKKDTAPSSGSAEKKSKGNDSAPKAKKSSESKPKSKS